MTARTMFGRVGRFVRLVAFDPRAATNRVIERFVPSRRTWFRSNGFITFRSEGFVRAGGPESLLTRHNYETAEIRRHFNPVGRSLEVGCGYGRLSSTFAELASEHVAVDLNLEALATAHQSYPSLVFGAGSVTALPLGTGAFDRVVTWTVIQHVPPAMIDQACSELTRVLAPGGAIVLCEETADPPISGTHTWHRSIEQYAALFEDFKLEHVGRIGPLDSLPGHHSPGTLMILRHR